MNCPGCGEKFHFGDTDLASGKVKGALDNKCPYCKITLNEPDDNFCSCCGYQLVRSYEESIPWLFQKVRELETKQPRTGFVSDNFYVRLLTFIWYGFLAGIILKGISLGFIWLIRYS